MLTDNGKSVCSIVKVDSNRGLTVDGDLKTKSKIRFVYLDFE